MKKYIIIALLFVLALTTHAQITINAPTSADYVQFVLVVNGSQINTTIHPGSGMWTQTKYLNFADHDAVRAFVESKGVVLNFDTRVCFKARGKQANCYGANCVGNWSHNLRCFDFAADSGFSCDDCIEIALGDVQIVGTDFVFDVCEVDELAACVTILNTFTVPIPVQGVDTLLQITPGVWAHVNNQGIQDLFGATYNSTDGSINSVVTWAVDGTAIVDHSVDWCESKLPIYGDVYIDANGCFAVDSVVVGGFGEGYIYNDVEGESQWLNRDLYIKSWNPPYTVVRDQSLDGFDFNQRLFGGGQDGANVVGFWRANGTPEAPTDLIAVPGGNLLGANNYNRYFDGAWNTTAQTYTRAYGNDSAIDSVQYIIAGRQLASRADYAPTDAIARFDADTGEIYFDNYPGDIRNNPEYFENSVLFSGDDGRIGVISVDSLTTDLQIVADCDNDGTPLIGLNNGSPLQELPTPSLIAIGDSLILAQCEQTLSSIAFTDIAPDVMHALTPVDSNCVNIMIDSVNADVVTCNIFETVSETCCDYNLSLANIPSCAANGGGTGQGWFTGIDDNLLLPDMPFTSLAEISIYLNDLGYENAGYSGRDILGLCTPITKVNISFACIDGSIQSGSADVALVLNCVTTEDVIINTGDAAPDLQAIVGAGDTSITVTQTTGPSGENIYSVVANVQAVNHSLTSLSNLEAELIVENDTACIQKCFSDVNCDTIALPVTVTTIVEAYTEIPNQINTTNCGVNTVYTFESDFCPAVIELPISPSNSYSAFFVGSNVETFTAINAVDLAYGLTNAFFRLGVQVSIIVEENNPGVFTVQAYNTSESGTNLRVGSYNASNNFDFFFFTNIVCQKYEFLLTENNEIELITDPVPVIVPPAPFPCPEFILHEVITTCPGTPICFPLEGLDGRYKLTTPTGTVHYQTPSDQCRNGTHDGAISDAVPATAICLDPGLLADGGIGTANGIVFGVWTMEYESDETENACNNNIASCPQVWQFHVIPDADCTAFSKTPGAFEIIKTTEILDTASVAVGDYGDGCGFVAVNKDTVDFQTCCPDVACDTVNLFDIGIVEYNEAIIYDSIYSYLAQNPECGTNTVFTYNVHSDLCNCTAQYIVLTPDSHAFSDNDNSPAIPLGSVRPRIATNNTVPGAVVELIEIDFGDGAGVQSYTVSQNQNGGTISLPDYALADGTYNYTVITTNNFGEKTQSQGTITVSAGNILGEESVNYGFGKADFLAVCDAPKFQFGLDEKYPESEIISGINPNYDPAIINIFVGGVNVFSGSGEYEFPNLEIPMPLVDVLELSVTIDIQPVGASTDFPNIELKGLIGTDCTGPAPFNPETSTVFKVDPRCSVIKTFEPATQPATTITNNNDGTLTIDGECIPTCNYLDSLTGVCPAQAPETHATRISNETITINIDSPTLPDSVSYTSGIVPGICLDDFSLIEAAIMAAFAAPGIPQALCDEKTVIFALPGTLIFQDPVAPDFNGLAFDLRFYFDDGNCVVSDVAHIASYIDGGAARKCTIVTAPNAGAIGYVSTAPNGTCRCVAVANDGDIITEVTTCP